MNKEWEVTTVSSLERIAELIVKEMVTPTSIVLFGADCKFKNEVVEEFQELFPNTKLRHGVPGKSAMNELVRERFMSIFVMNSIESSSHQLRREFAELLRRAGAQTVVGFYVKVQRPLSLSARGFIGRPDLQLMDFTVKKLEQTPPLNNEFDHKIVICNSEHWSSKLPRSKLSAPNSVRALLKA